MIPDAHIEQSKTFDFLLRKSFLCKQKISALTRVNNRACKFRFEIVFNEFDPSEIARKTDKGLVMMKSILATFCECAIRELREQVDLIQKQK